MDLSDDNLNRRGSLAISALLNNDSNTVKQQSSSGDVSPVLSSGTTSPIMGASGSSSQLSKTKRKRISPAQYNRLMEIFDQTDTPSSEIRENLAEELDMTKREVQVWFQNRRAKRNRTKYLQQAKLQHHHHRHSLIPHSVSNSINNANIMSNKSSVHYQVKSARRASAYPVLENNNNINNLYKPQMTYLPPHPQQQANGRFPIAPMPSKQEHHVPFHSKVSTIDNTHHPHHHPPPQHHAVHSYHPYSHQHKPSAIDLLASAAEYVRTDRKEMTFSRT